MQNQKIIFWVYTNQKFNFFVGFGLTNPTPPPCPFLLSCSSSTDKVSQTLQDTNTGIPSQPVRSCWWHSLFFFRDAGMDTAALYCWAFLGARTVTFHTGLQKAAHRVPSLNGMEQKWWCFYLTLQCVLMLFAYGGNFEGLSPWKHTTLEK